MQKSVEEKLNPDYNLCSEAKISQEFYTHLKLSKQDDNGAVDNHGHDEDEDEEDFSFMCGGANTSPIAAEDIFIDGQIRPIFPLFNRDLLFSVEDPRDSLPVRPPVKVFVETSQENGLVTSSSPENSEVAGPHCKWSDWKAVEASPSPEICKKSNSTGFSKIWRFKDFLGRSNSDGRDAFVFLNSGRVPLSSAAEQPVSAVKGDEKKGLKDKGKEKGKKVKTASLSAHEVYLRSKAPKEERRRSYLPYRPELMGFFTNVNGGLSKNVHPF